MKKKYSWWHTKISKFDKKEFSSSILNLGTILSRISVNSFSYRNIEIKDN